LVEDAGVLASTVGGLVLGAAVGGLAGALLALRPTPAVASISASRLTAQARNAQPAFVSAADIRRTNDHRVEMEGFAMDAEEEVQPEDIPTVTGTAGQLDPDTGAYGTGGTPLTTGYGASGSTVGVGSPEIERIYREGDFTGATPDSAAYDTGGRASTEAVEPPREQDRPTTAGEPHAPATAPAPQESAAQDIYVKGPSYGPQPAASTDTEETAGTEQARIDTRPPQASEGTDIPGTADPRGLGDNTG
jgi:hypothetical protein